MTRARSVRSLLWSPLTAPSKMLSGVSLASKSSISTADLTAAFSCASRTFASASWTNFVMTDSMLCTLVFCAMFLYCMRPSFAVRPLRMSTHSSMKRCMMGSSDVSGVDLNRFEENISVNDCSAACVWPTETSPSACFSTVSGLEKGAILD